MAYEPRPNESQRSPQMRDPDPLEHEFQADPELTEGRAGSGRIAIIAVAIAVILGMVFYGLNSTSVGPSTQPSTTATNSTTSPNAPHPGENVAEQTKPPVAPGVRDVTPRNNTTPGVTTGNAPANNPQPQAPASPGTAK